MTIESATYISGLNATYPAAGDPKSEGDDHLRLIKSTVKATLPNVTGAVAATHAQLDRVLDMWAADTIASATTTDLGSKAASILTVSGTTTITGFGTIASGILKYLIFGDVLTLTHNGTSLILPTGANIKTAAGDVALVVSLGSGNWRCLHYLPKNGDYVRGKQVNTLGTSGAVTVDTSLAETHYLAPTGNVTSMSFTNPAPSGQSTFLTIIVAMGTSYTVAWPASVKWPGAAAPASTLSGASKTDIFSFMTRDGGTTWFGAWSGRAYA
jgi:hypothetical protein